MTEITKEEFNLELLEKLVASKKATASQKIQYAQLLIQDTQEELKKEKEVKIEKIIDLMEELEITKDEILKAFQKPPVKIFDWKGNVRFEGERGKLPSWAGDMKKEITKEEALKCVIANSDKGKVFVENLYKPKV